MRNLRSIALGALAAVVLGGCGGGTNACKSGTLFVAVTLDGAAAGASTLEVEVIVDGRTLAATIPHTPGAAMGTVEVDFPSGYPAGKAVTVTVIAASGAATLGQGSMSATLAGGCSALTVDVSAAGADLGMGDLTNLDAIDGANSDLTGSAPNGSACTTASQCASGRCIDGYCCDLACAGQCQACDVAGSLGTCSTVPSGAPHGTRGQCMGAGSACGGACTGTSATSCAYPGATTSCRAQSCTGGVKTVAAACDNMGGCPPLQTVTCSTTCSGTDCLGACGTDADCTVAGKPYCNSGACLATKPNGHTCTTTTECTTGNCVDGYCCDSACGATCQACDIAGLLGSCQPVTSGQPHGTRGNCTGFGSTCGGACSAASSTACTYPTVSCRSQSCAAGTKTLAASCAAGTCPTAMTTLCSPYTCNSAGTDCLVACAADTDCISSDFCDLTMTPHVCSPKGGQGSPCNASDQCTTPACVDGYCCNSTCTGSCQYCNLAGKLGTCSPAPQWSPGRTCTKTQTCDGVNVTCQACAAVPPAAQLHYVDAFLGTDDLMHGSGYGNCGYKTITFALTQATGQIALETYTYSTASNGETFPLVLAGNQGILCNFSNSAPATISGKGTYSKIGIAVTLAFEGTGNQTYNCNIDPGGGAGYCLDVFGLGGGAQRHGVFSNTFTNCGGFAIFVEPSGGGIDIDASTFATGNLGGLGWNTTSAGSVANNSFGGNNIQCFGGADTGLTGSGNTGTTAGKPSCTTCGNCPF